ncbi:MAG: hypothetical protein AABY64_10985 [Bdellovibrionota bacterium]
MGRKYFTKNLRQDNRGFIVISVIVMGIVITIVIASFLTYLQNENTLQARQRTRFEFENLHTAIMMMFSTPDICKKNIMTARFGTSLSELMSLSTAGAIQIFYPASAGPDSGVMVPSPNTASYYNKNQTKVFFTSPIKLNATDTTYLADLTIVVSDPASIARSIVIPFYLIADTTGNLVGCMATSYPAPTGAPPFSTMEDILCSQIFGPTSKFQPRDHVCI